MCFLLSYWNQVPTTLPFNHIVATKKVPLHQNYYTKRREGDEMATDIVAGSWCAWWRHQNRGTVHNGLKLFLSAIIIPKLCTLISLINVKSRLLILKKNTLHVYWFLKFIPPYIPRLLHLCTSFFPKNPTIHVYSNLHVYWFCNFYTPSTFIPTSTTIREMNM